jgi:hypothetical protein
MVIGVVKYPRHAGPADKTRLAVDIGQARSVWSCRVSLMRLQILVCSSHPARPFAVD